jgi:glycosyltransferase involved in cell wall biosynthesis
MPAVDEVLVVMPALNEAESVAAVIAEVQAALPHAGILVVDDGSSDGTAAVAREAGARVAVLPYNLGVGGAMRLGFRYAQANGFRYVVQVDADGQHVAADIPKLLDQLEVADVVLGARFAGEGEYDASGPRRWAMVVLAGILSRLLKTRISDATSGFRLSGPRAIEVFAEHYPAEYLGDTVESLVIASRSGLVVRQIPVAMRHRSTGVPSQNPFRSARHLMRAMLALMFALLRPSSTYRMVTR